MVLKLLLRCNAFGDRLSGEENYAEEKNFLGISNYLVLQSNVLVLANFFKKVCPEIKDVRLIT